MNYPARSTLLLNLLIAAFLLLPSSYSLARSDKQPKKCQLDCLLNLTDYINRKLSHDSPGHLRVIDDGYNQPHLFASGDLILVEPLHLSLAEFNALLPTPAYIPDRSNQTDSEQLDVHLRDFHHEGGNLLLVPGKHPTEKPEQPPKPDRTISFSAQAGFSEPYLIQLSGDIKSTGALKINTRNLPPTSTGCYLSGVVVDALDSAAVFFDPLDPEGMQQPECMNSTGSILPEAGNIPVVESPKGKRPSRAQVRGQGTKKQDDGAAEPPPPPPPSPPPPEKNPDDAGDRDEDRDKDNPKKQPAKKKPPKAEPQGANMRLLKRYLKRSARDIRERGQLHRRSDDQRLISVELAAATPQQWQEIAQLEDYQTCREQLQLQSPPPGERARHSWRQPEPIVSESEDEDQEPPGATGGEYDAYY